jgi:transposase
MFKSGTKSGDYHHEMNFDNCERWLKTKLIPNLPPNSVLLVDNAAYHNVQLNPAPTSSSRKSAMIDWLSDRGILFTDRMCKPELYSLIKLRKLRFKTFKIDALLAEHGHSALRLPPYHPDLNPIELIWASVKEYVARKSQFPSR